MNKEFIVVGCSSCNRNKGAIYVYSSSFGRKFLINGDRSSNRVGDQILLQKDELADTTRLWYSKGQNITYDNMVTVDNVLYLE